MHSGRMEAQFSPLAQQQQGVMAGRLIANRVFVGNLPNSLAERDLMALFSPYGKIRDVKIIPENSRNKSYGFVTFFSEGDARRLIQATMHQESVMWGERKLNVAPAFRRNVLQPTCVNGYYSVQRDGQQIQNLLPTTVYHGAGVVQPQTVEQQVQIPTDNNNGLIQAYICRLPHQAQQYPMANCQYPTTTAGHYFVAPGYQPYVSAAPVLMNHQAAQYAAATAAATAYTAYGVPDNYRPPLAVIGPVNSSMPLTPNSSSDNADGQLEELDSNQAGDKGRGAEGVAEVGQRTNGVANNVCQVQTQQQQAVLCCAHHSCVMTPLSPVARAAALARSCQMIHPAAGCYAAGAGSPLLYSSPMVYGAAAGRRPVPGLQRWNSLDANLGQQQQQQQQSGWNHENSCSHPSLDDAYASEAGLFPSPHRIDGRMRQAYPYQHHGMISQLCRSHEYNLWGQVQNGGGDLSETPMGGDSPASSRSSLSLSLNLNDTLPQTSGPAPEQVQ